MPTGAELARLFHADVVAPLLARELPRLRYAAGRLGSGSDRATHRRQYGGGLA